MASPLATPKFQLRRNFVYAGTVRLCENPWKNNKILILLWQEKMIRGKYEAYSGRPHLSADRQAGRKKILSNL